MDDWMAYCHTSTVAAEADHLFLQNAGQGEKGDSRLSLTVSANKYIIKIYFMLNLMLHFTYDKY